MIFNSGIILNCRENGTVIRTGRFVRSFTLLLNFMQQRIYKYQDLLLSPFALRFISEQTCFDYPILLQLCTRNWYEENYNILVRVRFIYINIKTKLFLIDL